MRRLLGRTEQVTLIVCHELALRLIIEAAAGPGRARAQVANAVPYLFDEQALRGALDQLASHAPAAPLDQRRADAAA